jgi:hypothetical protein
MPTFIIRSHGFFYTDEYYAPGDVFKQVVKKTFPTKAAAEKVRLGLVREWVRAESLGNYVFDDRTAVDAVWKYLREEWPDGFEGVKWLHDAEIPEDATDKQVDEIVKRMGVTFAQVFEVEGDADEGGDEGEEDDDGEDEDADDGDLYFGPTP